MKIVLTVWDDGLWLAQVDPDTDARNATIAKGTWQKGGAGPQVYCDSGCDELHRRLCDAVASILRAQRAR